MAQSNLGAPLASLRNSGWVRVSGWSTNDSIYVSINVQFVNDILVAFKPFTLKRRQLRDIFGLVYGNL